MRSVPGLPTVLVDAAFEAEWHRGHSSRLGPLCGLCRDTVAIGGAAEVPRGRAQRGSGVTPSCISELLP